MSRQDRICLDVKTTGMSGHAIINGVSDDEVKWNKKFDSDLKSNYRIHVSHKICTFFKINIIFIN